LPLRWSLKANCQLPIADLKAGRNSY